jgi:pilus assembly protein CpaC
MTAQQASSMMGRLLGTVVITMSIGGGSIAFAQDHAEPPATQPAPAIEASKSIDLPVSRSTLIQSPWPVSRVTVTDPKIADVQVLTPRQVLVLGKAIGSTDLLMWGNDTQVWKTSIEVHLDRTALKEQLGRLFPRARLDLAQARGSVVVTGQLSRAEEAEQLHRYLQAAGVNYVDLTSIPGPAQVQLKVTIAEASRSAVRALGFNAIIAGKSAFGGITIGPENSGPLNPMNISPVGTAGNTSFPVTAPVTPAATLFGGVPSADLEIFIQALAENQYLRVLAEPTLVALSGQEASFLAGGEFPIPVPQNSSGSTTITVEYKEFGVRLRFRPTIMGDGLIRLHVAPEVSDISNGPGSVQISGFNIPALLTRRVETTLEMHSGQTFAMAGLISQNVEARNSRVPGLGDVPILGPLFRSVRYKSGDTELLVLVTASTVAPMSTLRPPTLPGSTHVRPNDWEFYTMGSIEGGLGMSHAEPAPAGDAGFSQLKGPGAWASFEPSDAVVSPQKK